MNKLFPVFVKIDQVHILIVGGNNVGFEKLNALLQQDAQARIKMVSVFFSAEVRELARRHTQVELIERPYRQEDLEGVQWVIGAANDRRLHEQIAAQAKERNIMVNIADTPELCDFYLSSIVRKGHLKIAISTNGRSPTLAKRIREMLEDVLPEDISLVLEKLSEIRNGLRMDFREKVAAMNKITELWTKKREL